MPGRPALMQCGRDGSKWLCLMYERLHLNIFARYGCLAPLGATPFCPLQTGCSVRRVKGGAFQRVQAPARQGLQPEATGAGMEVTKCLKPSDSASRFGDARECAGGNASER